jgi:hypothetical protein
MQHTLLLTLVDRQFGLNVEPSLSFHNGGLS